MNKWFNVFFLISLILFVTNGLVVKRNTVALDEKENSNASVTKSNNTLLRKKRVFDFSGGLAMGFGAYDYYNYYGDLVSDYSYDYYDWICSETSCQLCDVLTSECCDPDVDVNCYLPDSCFNNPCLSGGTCITARTVDNRPDFTCICLPGLTGKYCQLVNDYFLGAERLAIALMNPPAVLGGLGGVGLNIPPGQGAPPLPPALSVLSEMQRRLNPPPFQSPGSSDNQQNKDKKDQNTNQQPQEPKSDPQNPYYKQMQASYIPSNKMSGYDGINPANSQINAQQASYQPNSLLYAQKPSQQVNNQFFQKPAMESKNGFHKPLAGHRKLSLNQNLLNHQIPTLSQVENKESIDSTPTTNYQTSTKKTYKPSSGLKVLGSKRRSCPDGQIFNAEKNECVDFSLRKKTNNAEMTVSMNRTSEVLT